MSGPSGSGRTRLLQTAAEEAASGRGSASWRRPVRAVPAGGGSSRAVLAELGQDQPELLEALSPGCRDELATVAAGGQAGSRQRLMVAVRELLLTAAQGAGAVLVLDDLDQADPDTIDRPRGGGPAGVGATCWPSS